ncbi:MAG: S8 family serine peptidase [Alphaproteobacteria bacterium]|nr:S8 family serine peptidase [Alphaproteobacteria bacterium]
MAAIAGVAVVTALAIGFNNSPAHAQSKEPIAAALAGKSSDQTSISGALAKKGVVRIIVEVSAAISPSDFATPQGASRAVATVSSAQDSVLATHLAGDQKRAARWNLRRMKNSPRMVMTVTADELSALASDGRVVRIWEDKIEAPNLDQSVPLVGATATTWPFAHAYSVAILDTGVQKSHPFITSGRVVAEACFSTTSAANGSVSVCPSGEGAYAGAGVNCASNIDGCDHGTHVAGIAAGNRTGASGPARGVANSSGIIAVQVFSNFNSGSTCTGFGKPTPCALTFTSDQLQALDYIQTIAAARKVAAVNMSLGGGNNSAPCDSDSRKTPIDNLRAAGVATVISSGNSGTTNSGGAPGCISSAITVGSSTKSDGISSFSSMHAHVDVMAPGSSITSSVLNNGFSSFNGTSMAAPHVAGAFALLKSCDPTKSVTQIEQALESTGTPINDSRSGGVHTKPRIRVDLAAQSLGCSSGGGTITVTPSTLLTSSGPVGGPFSPNQRVYTITSTQQFGVINWTANATQNWLTMSPTSGSLNPGASANVTVTINSAADGLGVGNYAAALNFNSGGTQIIRNVSLGVSAPNSGNDNFANASLLTGSTGTRVANNAGATGESGEPNHAGTSTPLNSLWWRYVAPATGKLNLSTGGSDFDTTLAAYRGGSVSNLTGVGSNDDHNPPNRTSYVRIPVVKGNSYYIAVDGWSSETGNIQLTYNQPPARLSVTPARRLTARRVGQRLRYRIYNRGGKDIIVRVTSTSWLTHRPGFMRIPAYTARFVTVTVNGRARRFRGGRSYIGRMILRPVGQRAIVRTILYRPPAGT